MKTTSDYYAAHPDYTVCTLPICGRKHYLTPYAVTPPVGACDTPYGMTLDGLVMACTLPSGHEGDHEEHNDITGEIRAWVATERN